MVFDPASFYGHHEFDLAITRMFGGFDGKFYDAYHKLIPKSPGFATRHKLYILFHYLNHWYANNYIIILSYIIYYIVFCYGYFNISSQLLVGIHLCSI